MDDPKPAVLTTVASPKGRGKKARVTVAEFGEADAVQKRLHGVDVLEDQMRRNGPSPWAGPGAFTVLAVPADIPARIAIQSLAAFAHPAVVDSAVLTELVTWSSTHRGWHLVFFFSVPMPPAWMEEEHYDEPLQDLGEYVILENWSDDDNTIVHFRNRSLRSWDVGVPSDDPFDDVPPRPGRRAVAIFETITGITIAETERALAHGEPWWLVHGGKMVFPINWD